MLMLMPRMIQVALHFTSLLRMAMRMQLRMAMRMQLGFNQGLQV
jgi:hypothetical protein